MGAVGGARRSRRWRRSRRRSQALRRRRSLGVACWCVSESKVVEPPEGRTTPRRRLASPAFLARRNGWSGGESVRLVGSDPCGRERKRERAPD